MGCPWTCPKLQKCHQLQKTENTEKKTLIENEQKTLKGLQKAKNCPKDPEKFQKKL